MLGRPSGNRKATVRPARRSKIRGSALGAVLAVVFVMLIAVLALHHQQSVARRAYTQAEADLRFREGRRFALRERFLGIASPTDLKVKAQDTEENPDGSHPIPDNFASKMFEREGSEWSGLPDLKAVDAAHAHKYLELKPETNNASLQVFGKRTYRVVESEIPGYAAYAPQGAINLERVEAWGNPTFEDEGETLEAYSGVPVVLGARGDIQVGEMAYGEAHSSDGNVDIGAGEGIGFVGPLPLIPYEDQIMSEAQAAKGSLDGATNCGDKTSLLNGNALSLGGMIDLFFGGGSIESLMGLRQAFNFPMPMIPGFSQIVPGILYEFWFHVPYPPDGGFTDMDDPDVKRLQQLGEQQTEATKQAEELKKKVDEAVAARQAAQAAFDADPSAANEIALNAAKAAEQDAKEDLEDVTEALEDMAEEAKTLAENGSASGMAPIPQTRNQDPSGTDGVFGWNYSTVIGNMLGLLLDTITGDFENIASRVSAEVRLVHYGPADEVPQFEFGSTFVARSTVTVPRGRQLQYNGNMEIRGDLWLQRGSAMAVHGDLRLVSPGAPSTTDPKLPSGRLFLEEGATLIVSGNFECQGTPQFGSIMVGGEPGEIHPLTAAILVDGDITIPNGIYSGSTLEDLVGIDALEDAIRPLLEQGAPNVSKVAGPFHYRRPYFARFASTFQLTIIPPTLFNPPIPIPTPIPMPKENILVFAFRALSLGYTATLNATLGENLYPQCDWWPFGNGVVPMTTKISPEGIASAIEGGLSVLASADLDELTNLEATAREFAETFLPTALEWVVKEGVQKLVKEVAVMLMPGGSMLLDSLVTALIDVLDEREQDPDELFSAFIDKVTNTIAGPAQEVMGNILTNTDLSDYDNFLREHSGALIYAGRNINVGSEARTVTGMFVAGDSINIEADLTIGTLMARNGSVRAKRLLYYPYFNQASLYVPKATPSNWAERAATTEYGAAFDSGVAVQVGPPPVTRRVMAEGWER